MPGMEFDFSKIEAAVDKTVSALDRLDKRLGDLEKRSNAFNRLFGSQRQFDQFIESVQKLDAVKATAFKSIADGISGIAKAINALPDTERAANIIRSLGSFLGSMAAINVTKTKNTNISAFLNDLVTSVQKLITITSASAEVNTALTVIRNLFRSINEVTTLFSGIGKVQTSSVVINSVYGIIAGFIEIAQRTEANLTQLEAVSKMLTAVARLINQVRGISSLFRGLSPATGIENREQLAGFILSAIPDVQRLSMVAASLKLLESFITKISKIATSVDIDAVRKLSAALDGIRRAMQFIFSPDFIPQTPADFIQRIASGITAIGQIGFLSSGISRVTAKIKNIEDLSKLGGAVESIARALKIINNFSSAIGQDTLANTISENITDRLRTVLGITTQLDPIFQQIVKLATGRVVEQIKRFFGVSKISVVLSEIGFVARELAKIAGSIPNLDMLSSLGRAMENLAQGLKIIDKVSKGVPTGFVERIKRFLGIGRLPEVIRIIGYTSQQLSKVAGNITNLDSLANLGKSLNDIGNFLRTLDKADIPNVRMNFFEGLFNKLSLGLVGGGAKTNFQKVINSIKDIAKAFKGFKGIIIPDFGTILPGLSSFIEQARTIDFKKVNLAGFSAFATELGKGLRIISGIQVDKSKLSAIGSALAGISSFRGGSLNIQQNVGNITRSSGGIIQSAVGELLGKVAFSALSRVGTFISRLSRMDVSIRNSLTNIGRSFERFGYQAQYIGGLISRNFGLGALTRSQGLETAATFDQLSSRLQVFGNLTDEETKQAQEFADVIGIKYPLSANDAIQAMLDLSKAGQDLASIKFILPAAADLATLGDIDLPTATQALIAATGAFNEFSDGVVATYDNVGTAATVLSGAADATTAVVQSLIEGIADVGPIAREYGIAFDEVNAILGEFEDVNLRGSKAGRALRALLSSLVRPQAIDTLKALQDQLDATLGSHLDLDIGNVINGSTTLDQFIKNLNETYKRLGLSQAQITVANSKLADTFGRSALSILLANNGYDEMLLRIQSTESASDRAAKLIDNFKGEVDQFAASIETLTKNAFLPMLSNAFRPFIHLARQIVDGILNIGKTSPQIYEVASNFLLLASSAASVVGILLTVGGVTARFEGIILRTASAFLLLTTRIPGAILGVASFAASFSIMLISIGAVASAIAGVSIIFTEFRRVISENVGGAGDAFETLKYNVQSVLDIVGPVLNQIGRSLGLIFGPIIQGEVNKFGDRVARFFNGLSESANNVRRSLEQIGAIFEVFGTFVQAGFGGESQTEIKRVDDLIRQLATLPLVRQIFGQNANVAGIRRVFNLFRKGFESVARSVDNILSGAIGVLFGESGASERVQKGVSSLLSAVSKALQTITGFDLSDAILEFDRGDITAGINRFLGSIISSIHTWFMANRNEIANTLADIFYTFTIKAPFDVASTILKILGFDDVARSIIVIRDRVGEIIRGAFRLVIGLISGDVTLRDIGIQGILESFLGDPAGAVTGLADTISNLITEALGRVPDLLRNIGTQLNISEIIDLGLSLESSEAWGVFSDAIGAIAASPIKAIGDLIKALTDMAKTEWSPRTIAFIVAMSGLLLVKNAGGIMSGIASGFKSFVNSPLVKLALLADYVSAITASLEDFQRGNFGSGFVKFIGQLASEIVGEETAKAGTTAGEQILGLIEISVSKLAAIIGELISKLFDQFGSTIQRFLYQLNIGSAEAARQFMAVDTAVSQLGDSTTRLQGLRSISEILGDAKELETIKQNLRGNADAIDAVFNSILAGENGIKSLSDQDFASLVNTLLGGGRLDEALVKLAAGPDGAGAVRDFLIRAFANQDVNVDLLSSFNFRDFFEGLSNQALITDKTALFNALFGGVTTGLISEDSAKTAAQSIVNALNTQIQRAGGEPIVFDFDAMIKGAEITPLTINTAEEIAKESLPSSLELVHIQNNVIEQFKGQLSGIQSLVLANFDVDARSKLLDAIAGQFGPLTEDELKQVLQNLSNQTSGTYMSEFIKSVSDSINTDQTIYAEFKANVVFDEVKTQTQPLIDEIRRQIEQQPIQATVRVQIDIDPESYRYIGGGGYAGSLYGQKALEAILGPIGGSGYADALYGRANGGSLQPYSAYKVHDTRSPEIATMDDGTSILLTGQAGGKIVKMLSMASAPLASTVDLSGGDIASIQELLKQTQAKKDQSQKDIEKLKKEMSDAELDFFQKEAKYRKDANDAELEAIERFNHERSNILSEGHDSVLEAIRSGDGAAALAASKNAKKQIAELEYNFNQEKESRDKNLQDQLMYLEQERQQRRADFADRLQELQDQDAEISDELDSALEDQDDFYRSLEDQRAQSNADVLALESAYGQSLLAIALANNKNFEKEYDRSGAEVVKGQKDTTNALINDARYRDSQIKNIFSSSGSSISQIAAAIGGLIDQLAAKSGAIGIIFGGVKDAIGTIGDIVKGSIPPIAPKINDVWQDFTGKYWYWNGRSWVPMPGRAQGGNFSARSAIRVHDTNRSELLTMSNGQSMFLSGPNSGRVTPLPPGYNPPRYRTSPNDAMTTINMKIEGIYSNASDPMEVANYTSDIIMPKIKEAIRLANKQNRSKSILDINTD